MGQNTVGKGKSMIAKKFALGFGIAVLFPLTVHYAVKTFSPAPIWEDYEIPHYYERHQNASPDEQLKLEAQQDEMNKKRRQHEKYFQKNLFFVTTPLGIIAIIAGSLIVIQAVGSGLMFGGIFCLIDGYVNYWSELPDAMRFASLLAALVVLLVIGFKKFNEHAE